MRGEHERFEELAVGHVLGGLDSGASATFRSHLQGCRDCRSRVAELRELADDLAAAERDERARAQVRTEVARRDESAEDPPGPRIGVRHVTIAAVAVMLLAGVVAFWNLHLRTAASTYQQVADYRGETLRELAQGVTVPAVLAEGVSGLVIMDEDQVAFTFAGLPALAADERVEVWLLTADGPVRGLQPVPGERLEDGVLAGYLTDPGADVLLFTRERGAPAGEPGGTELVRAQLRSSGSSSK